MNKIIKNTLILTAITLVSGLLLGFVHELTAAPIAEQEALAKAKAYAEVFPEAASFNELEDISDVAAGLHRTAEGGAGAAIAAAESHSAEPLAPAEWEAVVAVEECAHSGHDAASRPSEKPHKYLTP